MIVVVFSVITFLLIVILSTIDKNENFITPSNNQWTKDFLKRVNSHEPVSHGLLIKKALTLPRNSVIVDAGAHVGDTTFRIAKALQRNKRFDLKIYAIDPNASKIQFMKELAHLNKLDNIFFLHKALGDKKGYVTEEKTVKGEEMHPGGWRVKENPQGGIEITTLSDIIPLSQKLGLIHFDLEGYEFKAFKGCLSRLKSDRPIIMFEYVHDQDQSLHLLKSIGYKKVWEGERNILVH